MKRLLAIVLALVIILSMSVAAYAAGSPTKTPTSDDVAPEASPLYVFSPEQYDAIDKAMAAATEEGIIITRVVPIVNASEEKPYEETVELAEDELLLVYTWGGELLQKLTAKDLKDMGNNLSLKEPCIFVVGKAISQ